MADSIKVKNIYYMLSYASQNLHEAGIDQVAAEEFDHIHDLFAAILIRGVGDQIRRGLHKNYVPQEETIGSLRGRIQITESIKQQTMLRRKMVCLFDEFTEDTLHNQILKQTMLLLLRMGSVRPDYKKELRKLLMYLGNVTDIAPRAIRWDALRYHRNNATYKMLINICWLVINGLLLTTESGGYRLARWLADEQMHRLYERFVLAYYQRHHPEFAPRASYINWDIAEDTYWLPVMKSDITLTYKEKTIIIDTKWYSKTMQTNSMYDSKSFISSHMYQIFTYVKNKDRLGSGNVAGVLLYAKTNESITPDNDLVLSGNRISLKTLDLGREWDRITEQLESLCSWLLTE
ncbi:5-methylcytosine-specific restriction endonuclease system specificity protein McrC [Paenibacillus lentus]|uniref:5-methylcytosine-specific restriction endonuclease system specificity protein McrC n=1 Tax=Paenibacillus lentus TaxID=1338368 RepID=UPI001FE96D1B|nr:5-methylcytosine-specific restriction endonuclease system specificity protein McrC [Paenibacillus lentus]